MPIVTRNRIAGRAVAYDTSSARALWTPVNVAPPINFPVSSSVFRTSDSRPSVPRVITFEWFGFDIPGNARITGVTLTVNNRIVITSGTGPTNSSAGVAIEYVGGSSNDKSLGTVGNSYGNRVAGGASDLWGLSDSNFKPMHVIGQRFGFLMAHSNVNPTNFDARFDINNVSCEVRYREPVYYPVITSVANVNHGEVFRVTYRFGLFPGGGTSGSIPTNDDTHQNFRIPVILLPPEGVTYLSHNITIGAGTYDPNTSRWEANFSNKVAEIVVDYRAPILPSGVNEQNYPFSMAVFLVGGTSLDGPTHRTFVPHARNVRVFRGAVNITTSLGEGTVTNYRNGDIFELVVNATSNGSEISTLDIITNLSGISVTRIVAVNGSYNASTGVWKAEFNQMRATLRLQVVASGEGLFTQQFIHDGNVRSSATIRIEGGEWGPLCFAEGTLPKRIQDEFMLHGDTYTIACWSRVTDNVLSNVFGGPKNNCISVRQGNVETVGSRCSSLNNWEKIYATFIYDSTHPVIFRLYDQYLNMALTSFTHGVGWELYKGELNEEFLFTDPIIVFDDMSKLLEDTLFTHTNVPSKSYTAIFEFSDIFLSGLENVPNLIKRGIGIAVDYDVANDMILEGNLVVDGKDSNRRSVLLRHEEGTVLFGGETDRWGLTNTELDLKDIRFKLRWINNSSSQVNLRVKNVRFVLFHEKDITGDSYGFTVNGQHSREFNIVLNDPKYSYGANTNITALSVNGSLGELPLYSTVQHGKLEFFVWVVRCGIENADKVAKEVTRWLTGNRDKIDVPEPQSMIFDWKKDVEYLYILDGDVEVAEIKNSHIKLKLKMNYYDGVAWSVDEKITGETGANNGIIPVAPIIEGYVTERNIVVMESYTKRQMEFKSNYNLGDEIVIDNPNFRIYNKTTGEDISTDITMTSEWFLLENDFDFTESIGFNVTRVIFKEGD